MTNPDASGFTAAEFAELRAITSTLHGKWFHAWEGVHPADLPAPALALFKLESLVGAVGERNDVADQRAKPIEQAAIELMFRSDPKFEDRAMFDEWVATERQSHSLSKELAVWMTDALVTETLDSKDRAIAAAYLQSYRI